MSVRIAVASHPAEVSEHLREALGLPVSIAQEGAEYVVSVAGATDAAITAALVGFTATTTGSGDRFRGSLPTEVRAHVQHLRDFVIAQRAGAAITNAQRDHALADLILAVRLLVDDRAG